jgi:predicted RNase H-like nuclease (RuvC/YqgF family)
MGLGSDFLSILKDTVKLTDSVERLNTANAKLQDKVEGINERVIKLETRLDTYVEIAKNKRIDSD